MRKNGRKCRNNRNFQSCCSLARNFNCNVKSSFALYQCSKAILTFSDTHNCTSFPMYKQSILKLHWEELAALGLPLSQAEYAYRQQWEKSISKSQLQFKSTIGFKAKRTATTNVQLSFSGVFNNCVLSACRQFALACAAIFCFGFAPSPVRVNLAGIAYTLPKAFLLRRGRVLL